MKKNLFLIVCLVFSTFSLKAQNAVLVKDLTPGASSSFDDLTKDVIVGHLEDKLLFVLKDASSIAHLYVSDGTASGTIELKTLASSDENFQSFVKANATTMAFVVFNSSSYTFQLYTTDGISTTLLDKHDETLSIENLKINNGALMYSSDNYSLHIIDLSNTIDQVVMTMTKPFIDFYVEGIQKIYYGLRYAAGDTLYVRDLIQNTTTKLGYIGQSNMSTLNFNKVGSQLLLFSLLPSNNRGLYATDGQASVTLLKTFYIDGETNRKFAVIGNKLFFDAVLPIDDPDFNGYELWVTDGTGSGTLSLSNANVPLYFLNYGTVYNNLFYFMSSAGDLSNELHLYSTDGTVTGTSLLFDDLLAPSLFQSGLISSNGKLYAAGYDLNDNRTTYGDEIWDISGSIPVLYETAPGSAAIYQYSLYPTDSKFFFIGNESTTGYELYLFDPQTPTIVTANTASQNKSDLFSCYPNPAVDQLTIEYKGTDQITALHLRDISGTKVRSFANENVLNMAGIESGIYFLEVELMNSKQVIKLVKK